MYTSLLAISLFLGVAYGSPQANQYMDSVLTTAYHNEVWALRLDPTSMEDFTTRYNDSMAIIGNVRGKAEYSNGNLTGLSEVIRHSDCQGPYSSFGARNINCSLSFEKLKVTYEGRLKYGKMPKVDIKGKMKIKESLAFVEISQAPPMQPQVKNFLYQPAGEVEVKHTGLGPLNRYTEILNEEFKKHVSQEVINFINQRFQYALNRAVASVPLPNLAA